MKQKPGFWSIMPADVRYDSRLVPHAKILYSEITALTTAKGYCWATNDYFAELYHVTDRTIRNWLEQLTEFGYIHCDYAYKKDSSEISSRRIYTSNTLINPDEDEEEGGKYFPGGAENNFHQGAENNFRDNKKIINNKINNIYSSKDEEREMRNVVELYNSICSPPMAKVIKLNDERKRKLRQRFKDNSVDDFRKAFEIAAASDWLSGRSGEFKASFDWFIKTDTNLLKVLEGQYSNNSKTGKQNQWNKFPQRQQNNADLEELENSLLKK